MNSKRETEKAKRLRKGAGQYIAALRKAADHTQASLSRALGYDWPTFIAQIESGHNRVPSEAMEAWARALNVDAAEFAKTLLRHYDPALFKLLFAEQSRVAEG